jgi:deoxyribonuclease-4
MYLGVHVSIGGHIAESIDRASALGCTAMQIFSRNPRQWRQLSLKAEDAEEFRRRRQASRIKVVAVHIPYLINLATDYDVLYKKSIAAYIEDIRETSLLGAEYLVTHIGSCKGLGPQEGLRQFARALNIVFEETRDIKGVRLLLENTAGSGHWLGHSFADHRYIFDNVKDRSRLGVCLDTAHLLAAGTDIRQPQVFGAVLDGIARKLGKKALRIVHLNDSKGDCGSHLDRHEHIGKGFIGLKGFRHIVNDPRLEDVAFILETPKDRPHDDKVNLDRVRRLMKTR